MRYVVSAFRRGPLPPVVRVFSTLGAAERFVEELRDQDAAAGVTDGIYEIEEQE